MRTQTVPNQKSTRGGARRGSGPKRKSPRKKVRHAKREHIEGPSICHVTLCIESGIPNLRKPAIFRVIEGVFRSKKRCKSFQLVHFSVQRNHFHLVVEVDSNEDLATGMQGLKVSLARQLNTHLGRSGSFFADRYHAVLVKKVLQTKNVMRYVFTNAKKHGITIPEGELDPYTSAHYFRGWSEVRATPVDKDAPIMPPRSCLLAEPALFYGFVSVYAEPSRLKRMDDSEFSIGPP